MSLIIVALICLIALQQIFYMREIQKLVDKIMSRNFGEYMQAKEPLEQPKVKVDEGVQDKDIEVMHEYMR